MIANSIFTSNRPTTSPFAIAASQASKSIVTSSKSIKLISETKSSEWICSVCTQLSANYDKKQSKISERDVEKVDD